MLNPVLTQLMQDVRTNQPKAITTLRQFPHLANQAFGQNEMTALLAAVCHPTIPCALDLFSELLAVSTDINAKSKKGATVLHYLALTNQHELLKVLVKEKAQMLNIDALTATNETPAFIAASKGHPLALKELIGAGSDINIANSLGQTPLHAACQQGDVTCVWLLLQAGAKNTIDSQARTPAHYLASSNATQSAQKEILEMLLAHGANLQAKTQVGNCPWELAQHHENTDLIAPLKAVPTLLHLCLAQLRKGAPEDDNELPQDLVEKLAKVRLFN